MLEVLRHVRLSFFGFFDSELIFKLKVRTAKALRSLRGWSLSSPMSKHKKGEHPRSALEQVLLRRPSQYRRTS